MARSPSGIRMTCSWPVPKVEPLPPPTVRMEIEAELLEAREALRSMSTIQQTGQEDYHGTTRSGDVWRQTLRQKIVKLERWLSGLKEEP